MSRHGLTISSLVVAVVLFFAVNIFAGNALTRWRADLTENKLYTLAEGTRNILENLEEPLTLRLFLSGELATSVPALASYTRRVEDLLREYERYAGGMIELQIIDPEPFSPEEDEAQRHGLRSIPVNEGGDPLYFGLVGSNSVDDTEVIAFLSPQRERQLEYDITRLVHQLQQDEPPVLGLVSPLPLKAAPQMMQTGRQSWLIVDQIEKLFEVESIDPESGSIAGDVDVLMVVHPSGLGEQMLYAIDQFVLSGGRALVFVDPYMESDPRGRGGPASGSDLEPIFEHWGVELLDDSIAADMQFAERVRYRRDGREVVGEFPVWLNLQPTQLDGDDVVTANLGNIFMATPGVLRQREGSGLTVTPLIRTGSRAASVDTSLIDGALSPAAIIDAYEPGSKALTLAARISGTATTAFPDGPPPAAEQEEAPAAQTDSTAHREEGEINVIAVADADLLHEQFWASSQSVLGSRIVIPTASNADFVVNALENLTGSSDLISVRSRGEFSRPFTRVAEIRQGAELRLRSKEQQLLDRLEETEQALLRLEQGKTGDGQDRLVLSEEQQQEIEQFRREKIRIRQELREVRHQLRKDIENLEGWLKFINIGLLPLLITVGATVVGVRRSRRRHR